MAGLVWPQRIEKPRGRRACRPETGRPDSLRPEQITVVVLIDVPEATIPP
jgi:hypothetical protein